MKTSLCVLAVLFRVLSGALVAHSAAAQQPDGLPNLEQRQPLELVFADSIVPQDRHETMLTTGAWYFKQGRVHHEQLTQKVEWGVSDKLQISAFTNALQKSNASGSGATGIGF